jgi:hypothetical protein
MVMAWVVRPRAEGHSILDRAVRGTQAANTVSGVDTSCRVIPVSLMMARHNPWCSHMWLLAALQLGICAHNPEQQGVAQMQPKCACVLAQEEPL